MTSLNTSNRFFSKHRFWFVTVFALIFMEIPVVSIPFKWFETYFHEFSHGLAALITGGKIISIQLFANGAGLCTTQGGSAFFISFFGYAGATIWGGLLYQLANVNKKFSFIVMITIQILLVLSILLWVRDILTAVILIGLIGLITVKNKLSGKVSISLLLQFMAICIVLNSVKSPWYLFDGQFIGDGATLAKITLLPELVWIVCWFVIGLLALRYIASVEYSNTDKN